MSVDARKREQVARALDDMASHEADLNLMISQKEEEYTELGMDLKMSLNRVEVMDMDIRACNEIAFDRDEDLDTLQREINHKRKVHDSIINKVVDDPLKEYKLAEVKSVLNLSVGTRISPLFAFLPPDPDFVDVSSSRNWWDIVAKTVVIAKVDAIKGTFLNVLGCVVKVINIDGGGEDGKLFYFNNDTTYGELFRDACSFHSIKEELFQFTVAKGTETQMIIAEDRLSTYKVREMCNWLLDNDCKIDIILHRKKEHENDQHIDVDSALYHAAMKMGSIAKKVVNQAELRKQKLKAEKEMKALEATLADPIAPKKAVTPVGIDKTKVFQQLFLYMTFVILFVATLYGRRHIPSVWQYVNAMDTAFVDEEFGDANILQYGDIATVEEFWDWLDPGSCAATWDAEISDPGPLVGAMFPIIGQNPDMMCFRPMRPFHTNIDYQAVNTPNITIATVEETDVVTGAVSVLEGQFNVFLTSTTPGATILYRIGVFLDQTLTTHLAPGKGNFGGADNSTFSCVPPTQCGFASCNVTFGIDKLCDPTATGYAGECGLLLGGRNRIQAMAVKNNATGLLVGGFQTWDTQTGFVLPCDTPAFTWSEDMFNQTNQINRTNQTIFNGPDVVLSAGDHINVASRHALGFNVSSCNGSSCRVLLVSNKTGWQQGKLIDSQWAEINVGPPLDQGATIRRLEQTFDNQTARDGPVPIQFYNYLVGGLRIQTVRVPPQTCESKLGTNFTCYPEYYQGWSCCCSKDPFGGFTYEIGEGVCPGYSVLDYRHTCPDVEYCEDSANSHDSGCAFLYREGAGVDVFENVKWSGSGSYDTSGFFVEYPMNPVTVRNGLSFLKSKRFVDEQTRAIIVTANLYNAGFHMMMAMTFVIEINPSGSVRAIKKFKPFQMFLYETAAEQLGYISEGLMIMYCLKYLWEELQAIQKEKRRVMYWQNHKGCCGIWACFGIPRSYWSAWAVLDWLIIILVLSTFFMRIQYNFNPSRIDFDISKKEYQDVTQYANSQLECYQLDSQVVFLMTIKFFRFFTLERKMYAVFVTMQRAVVDLSIFTVTLVALLMGFVLMGHNLFGQDYGFSSIYQTSMTLFLMMLNEFDVNAMAVASGSYYLTWSFFLMFNILMFFIMVTIFLSILNDSYMLVQVDVEMETAVERHARWRLIQQGLPIYKPKFGMQEILNLLNPAYKSWEDKQAEALDKRKFIKAKQLANYRKARKAAKTKAIKDINNPAP